MSNDSKKHVDFLDGERTFRSFHDTIELLMAI